MNALPTTGFSLSFGVPCAAWTAAMPDVESRIETAVITCLSRACPALEEAEISIVLVDDAIQRDLNHTWRDKDGSTNVLSFPATETEAGAVPQPEFPGVPLSLGDISLAFETIRDEATEQGKPFAHHVTHLAVHGVLHLLGYDHLQGDQAAVMEALEIDILGELGIADPYAMAEAGESDR